MDMSARAKELLANPAFDAVMQKMRDNSFAVSVEAQSKGDFKTVNFELAGLRYLQNFEGTLKQIANGNGVKKA